MSEKAKSLYKEYLRTRECNKPEEEVYLEGFRTSQAIMESFFREHSPVTYQAWVARGILC